MYEFQKEREINGIFIDCRWSGDLKPQKHQHQQQSISFPSKNTFPIQNSDLINIDESSMLDSHSSAKSQHQLSNKPFVYTNLPLSGLERDQGPPLIFPPPPPLPPPPPSSVSHSNPQQQHQMYIYSRGDQYVYHPSPQLTSPDHHHHHHSVYPFNQQIPSYSISSVNISPHVSPLITTERQIFPVHVDPGVLMSNQHHQQHHHAAYPPQSNSNIPAPSSIQHNATVLLSSHQQQQPVQQFPPRHPSPIQYQQYQQHPSYVNRSPSSVSIMTNGYFPQLPDSSPHPSLQHHPSPSSASSMPTYHLPVHHNHNGIVFQQSNLSRALNTNSQNYHQVSPYPPSMTIVTAPPPPPSNHHILDTTFQTRHQHQYQQQPQQQYPQQRHYSEDHSYYEQQQQQQQQSSYRRSESRTSSIVRSRNSNISLRNQAHTINNSHQNRSHNNNNTNNNNNNNQHKNISNNQD
jgi:hypothetical protein